MRILLTVHQFFPEYRAGTEVLTLSVAKELVRIGHNVHVYTGYLGDPTLRDKERFDEYDYEGIHVYRFHHAYVPMFGQTSMIEVGYKNKLSLDYFKTVIEKFRPDIVHHFHLNRLGVGCIDHLADNGIEQYFTPTDFWMICPTAQLMLGEGRYCSGPNSTSGNCVKHFARDSKVGGVKFLINYTPSFLFNKIARLTKNNSFIRYPMSNEVRAITFRLEKNISCLNKLNGIVVPNTFIKDLFIRYGVNPDLIYKSSFGINFSEHEVSPKIRREEQPLVLGFVGTLAPHKGCHIAIKSVLRLPKGSVKLKIYGSCNDFPEYYASLVELVGDSPVITFCGTFPNEKISNIMSDIDALVVPSIWYENTPLVIYSAQAKKCPVIGSNLPGIAEVVTHQHNGLLFEAGNINDLCMQISRLIDNGSFFTTLSRNAIKIKTSQEYVAQLLDLWNFRKEDS